MSGIYFATLAVLMLASFLIVRSRASALINPVAGGRVTVHSLPIYHGLLAATLVIVPMMIIYGVGTTLLARYAESSALAGLPVATTSDALATGAALREIQNYALGATQATPSEALAKAAEIYKSIFVAGNWAILGLGTVLALIGAGYAFFRVSPSFRARNMFEKFILVLLMLSATVAILTTLGILFSVAYETLRFFFDPALKGRPTVADFLFGTEWNPQAAMRADQGDVRTAFGFLPLLTGTLLITVIAITVAGPLGLFSAIYLSEYASTRVRAFAKPILEILAGIPTVVLGFFAALTVAPFIRGWGESVGLDIASESALAAGLVMGMMIIPFISSLSDDVINAVPQSLRDGSMALGSTKSETIRKVVLPAALPGIVSAFMLAISRAIGETMIVVMAAGLAANLTINPLAAVTTVTVQIKTILVGDQEFDSAKTLAAFALGFVLFFITLLLNMIALRIVNKYREQYD
ncbi:MAG: phosphate ABC transporter permease subunit PstC [Hyphomicrobiaceae bacterium]